MADIETATISEAAASNNAASPNGMPEGMAPSGVNDSWRENVAAQKRLWDRDHVTISSTGSDPTYVLTYLTAPTAYINGGRYAFRASFGNAGSASANVNALGSKTINQHTSAGLAVLAGGEIKTAHHVTLEYDSTADVLVIVSPTPASSGSLGTIASQNANNVSITGGSIAGITDLAVADGGTGRSTLTNHGVLIGAGTSAIAQTAAGTAGQVLTSNGSSSDPTFQTFAASGAKKIKVTVFTATGTYSADANLLCGFAETVGGGGGGGGINDSTSGGGGGGAGGYSRKGFNATDVGASQAVTIGVAGSAGNSSGTDGGSGGDTSFGSLCIGKGGSGGSGITTATGGNGGNAGNGGAGGVAGTGDVKQVGAAGGAGFGIRATGGFVFLGGYGASGPWGGGATSASNAGAANSGSGGSGGASGTTSAAGGAGAKGYCIVTEFLSA